MLSPLRRRLAGVAGALTLLSWAAASSATTVIARTFSELCRDADTIFVGRVAAVESRWVSEPGGAIETVVTFVDVDTITGADRPSIVLRLSGGEVDGVRDEVVGMPRFVAGERVVLFVRDAPAVSPIVGFNQGDFRLQGPRSTEHVVAGTGAVLPDGMGGGGAQGVPLEEFRRRIESELRARDGSR